MHKFPKSISDEEAEELLKSPTSEDPTSEFVRQFVKEPEAKPLFMKMPHEDLELFLRSLYLIENQPWLGEALDEAIQSNPMLCFRLSHLIGNEAVQIKLLEKIRNQFGNLLV